MHRRNGHGVFILMMNFMTECHVHVEVSVFDMCESVEPIEQEVLDYHTEHDMLEHCP